MIVWPSPNTTFGHSMIFLHHSSSQLPRPCRIRMVHDDVPITTHWQMKEGQPVFLYLSWSPLVWGEMHCFGDADGPLDTIFSINSEPCLNQEDLDKTKHWGKIPGQIKEWLEIPDYTRPSEYWTFSVTVTSILLAIKVIVRWYYQFYKINWILF